MLRRAVFAFLIATAAFAGRADAVTIRDVIELSKAGLGEPVLLALIEVDRGVFAIDTPTLKALKEAGVSDAVIVALIRSGRTVPPQEPQPPAAPPAPVEPPVRPEPQVIVIDHHEAPAPVAVPVAVPVYVAVPQRWSGRSTVPTRLQTDVGEVTARVPVPANCVKAEPVYWGFGGKLRPDSWPQPATVVCR